MGGKVIEHAGFPGPPRRGKQEMLAIQIIPKLGDDLVPETKIVRIQRGSKVKIGMLLHGSSISKLDWLYNCFVGKDNQRRNCCKTNLFYILEEADVR
jgi:hypothetical protein